MNIQLIGVIIDVNENTLGYRLLEVSSQQIKDVPAKALEVVLANNQGQVEGIKYSDGRLIGSNGSLSRYPKILSNSLYGKSPLIIINQLVIDGEVQGYTVVDWKGKILKVKKADVIKYSKVHGIANGMLRTREGTHYIASINGEYPKEVVNLPKKRVETVVKQEKKEEAIVKEKKTFKKPEPVRVNSFEDMVWEMIDFEDYMNMNSLSYDLKTTEENNTEIQFNCSRAERIKYPKGIETVNKYFSNINLEAQEIVFSPTIREINVNIFNMLPDIRSMVFQEGIEELNVPGCGRIEVPKNSTLHRLRFPTTLKVLKNGFNNIEKLESCNIEQTSMERMFKCFNEVAFSKRIYFPETLIRLKNTFNDCKGIQEISLPSSIKEIYESFNACGIRKLDLSNCKELLLLEYKSFMENKRLEEVDLPEGLKRIGCSVFKDCTVLKRVNIPSTVTEICDDAFSGTQIERVELGKSVNHIGMGVFNIETTIEFSEDVKKINNGVLRYTQYKKIELADGVEEIGIASFRDMHNLEEIRFPETLKKINRAAFSGLYSLDVLDLSKCRKLEEIGEEAFSSCFIKEIILPDSLEKLGDKAFKDCKFVKTMYIPRSVTSIGRGALRGVGSRNKVEVTYYVYSNSYAFNYCKRNKLRYIVVNSIEDYLNRNNSNEENRVSLAKIRLVLGGSKEHQELFKEPYKNYAEELYKLYSKVHETYTGNPLGLKITTEKLISFPIDKVEIVREVFEEDRPYKVDIHESNLCYNEDNLSPIFINLSNYVIKLLALNIMPLTSKGMEYMKEKSLKHKIVYRDKHSSIILYECETYSKRVKNITLVITIGSNIVYVTTFDTKSTENCTLISNLGLVERILKEELHKPISEIVTVGTSINISSKAVGLMGPRQIPIYIASEIANRFKEDTIIVGSEESKSYGKATKKVVSLDLGSGKVIVSNASGYGQYLDRYMQIETLGIAEIKSLDSLESRDKVLLLKGIDVESAVRRYTYIVDKDNYMKKLKSLESAYDTEPIHEWEIGQMLGAVNLGNAEEIPIEVYNTIFNTDLYKKSRKKSITLSKNMDECNSIMLKDCKHVIKEKMLNKVVEDKVPGRDLNFISYVITGEVRANDLVDCYYSSRQIESNINVLQAMYIGNKQRRVPKLDNKAITQEEIENEFIQLDSVAVGLNSYYLMINKYDGGVYYIGRRYGLGIYYKLLRFKDIKSACIPLVLSSKRNYLSGGNYRQLENIYECCFQIMVYLEDYNKGEEGIQVDSSKYIKMREEIMNGLPNGAYIPGIDIELIDLLAKQQ